MFWQNYVTLCNRIGKAPNVVAAEIGIKSTGTVTGWKNGAQPRPSVVSKLSEYFGVSVEDLLGQTDNKKAPTDNGGGVTDDDIKFALFNGADDITDEMYEEVKRFAEFVKQREREKRQ